MIKVYNKNNKISSPDLIVYQNLFNKFLNVCHFMPLPFLNFLPLFISALMQSESVILSDLASIIAPILSIHIDSADRKIRRFLSSNQNDFIFFFDKFISYLLSNFKIKHLDKKVYIAFDHMHIAKKFSILLFSLRVGKVGIPIWFRVFYYSNSDAFQLSLFQDGILFCHNLFNKIDSNSIIIFLADRFWGNHTKLMEYIDSLGDIFYIRTKKDSLVYTFDKKKKKFIYKSLSKLPHYVYHSAFYENITLTRNHFHCNLAISKSIDHIEPYYIVTNANPKSAIKEYSKRFGTVEFVFKNEKTNGFFLEETQIKSLKSLEALFVCICISQVLLTILGIDHSKNNKCYEDIKIKTTKIVNGKRKRLYSYFHVGLMIIKYFFKMFHPINLFNRLTLYDV